MAAHSDSSLGRLRGYRPQPTSQAYVHTAGNPDTSSIYDSRSHYTDSYFFHPRTSPDLDNSFFELGQNDVVFIIKNPRGDQVPLWRANLNGIDFSKESRDIISSIEDNFKSFDERTKNELVREILSKKIFPIGVMKGDGFSKPGSLDAAGKKKGRLTVDSAGTVSMRVTAENLGLGMPAEIKIPTRNEWINSEHFESGKISLFADPVENRSMHDKLSEIFWKFNIFEHPELAKLLQKTMTNKAKREDLPATLKLVCSFVNLMKQISLLTIQKAYSAKMIAPTTGSSDLDKTEICFNYPRRDPLDGGFIIAKLAREFDGLTGNAITNRQNDFSEIYQILRCEGPNRAVMDYKSEPIPASVSELDAGDKIYNPAFNPSFYKKSPLAENYNGSLFKTSIDILTFTFMISDIINTKDVNMAAIRKQAQVDKQYLSASKEYIKKEKKIYENNYNDMYHFLIHDFLPNVESIYYQLGNHESMDGQPELNTFCYEKVIASDNGIASNTNYRMNYERDIGRSNQHVHECFSNFLSKIVRWAKNMNHGFKMRVNEPGGHLQQASIHVR